MIKCPCKDCTKRAAYCHGVCKDYNEYRQVLKKIRSAKDADVYNEYIVNLMKNRRK